MLDGMANADLTEEIVDILTNDNENAERLLQYLAEDCTWVINPGGMTFTGLPEIRKFISIAGAGSGGKKKQPVKATLDGWFAGGDKLCVEYHQPAPVGNSAIAHCNVYVLRDGKIVSIHEYVSSSFWLFNVTAQMMFKRVWKKTKRQMQ